jgi:cobalt-precorrin 5A hydrolase
MKIAVVAITRHGIALAGKVAAALPGAQLFAPEKFRAER